MAIHYEAETDTLTVTLKPETYESYLFETGDFAVLLDEEDELIQVSITHASRFIAQALAAGIKVEDLPQIQPAKSGMVWYDADSSMISAFGYDEANQMLDVAFHRTGVYRYYDVPINVFEGLRDASSKGSYMRSMIIDMYPYEKKRGRSRR